ncbi:MAG TPA: Type 1 glutamine amidotransferase-like domain-containing protein [Gemmatimonadaceae bacterium]|nr:Type 1 glutamine amidotransferase-like domain-containing protein [Gemmatimonadaceae bacterium]
MTSITRNLSAGVRRRAECAIILSAIFAAACGAPRTGATVAAVPSGAPHVGPAHGSVIVVGGGAMGPEIYARFIQLAGGPDALIVDVPTAGGDTAYAPDWRGANGFKAAGAKHVVILHTIHRDVANSDAFIEPLKTAGAVWFEGGRQFHLVDSYAGTKTEQAFRDVLARGGVIGGSSAGASILGSFLVRGAPSNDNYIMDFPGYEKGFGYLRGVGIDQHVVARERLADLADSIMPRHPELLGISEDEGTAWVVQGDSAEIIGRDKAFVYGGKDPTDPGKPFLTLHPGDRYNLAARRVTHRASSETAVTQHFVDSLFAPFAKPGGPSATVLVAEDGKVFVDAAYGIPPQRKFMPPTTIPNFPLLGLSAGLNAAVVIGLERDGKLHYGDPFPDGSGQTVRDVLLQHEHSATTRRDIVSLIVSKGGASYAQQVNRRIYTPIGMHKTVADSSSGEFQSNVDELYRWELGMTGIPALREGAFGWRLDTRNGLPRESEFGTSDGKRNAFVRYPTRHAAIIILTSSPTADTQALADRIADRLFQTR